MNIIEVLEKEQLRTDVPEFRAGDTVKVFVKVVEGTRERIQLFEGVVIPPRDAPKTPQTVPELRLQYRWHPALARPSSGRGRRVR